MSPYKRHLLGVTGVVFLLIAIGLAVSGASAQSTTFLLAMCFRAGLVLIALWLALPSVVGLYKHFPKWVWVVSAAALGAAVVQKRLVIIVVVIFAILLFFQVVSFLMRPLSSDD